MPRGDQDTRALQDALRALFPEDAEAWCGRVLDLPRRPDRSEEIREDATRGLPLEVQLTPEVERYMRSHRLYGRDEAGDA